MKDELMLMQHASYDHNHFDLRTHDEYIRACERAEIWVTIRGVHLYRNILQNLVYDKSKSGGRGRCLKGDINVLGVQLR